jgi:hypothetical protein
MPALLGKGFIYSRRFDKYAFWLLFLTFLLTTSSVAYLMLIVAPILCLPVISKLGIRATRAVVYCIVGIVTLAFVGGALYVSSSAAQQVLNAALFAKGESYSSLERVKTIVLAWGYFKTYPILGVGWGSVTSHDLVAMILANSGILGLLAFVLILFGITLPLLRFMKGTPDPVTLSRAVWLLAGILLITSSIVSGFPFVFGFFWIVFAMGISASTSDYRNTTRMPSEDLASSQVVSG